MFSHILSILNCGVYFGNPASSYLGRYSARLSQTRDYGADSRPAWMLPGIAELAEEVWPLSHVDVRYVVRGSKPLHRAEILIQLNLQSKVPGIRIGSRTLGWAVKKKCICKDIVKWFDLIQILRQKNRIQRVHHLRRVRSPGKHQETQKGNRVDERTIRPVGLRGEI